MSNRRSFLKSAFAAPMAAAAAQKAPVAAPPMPVPGDPAYWTKIRAQFMLARDKVFFNNGTIGAMPRIVVDKTVEHLKTMATDIADWDYRGEEWIGGYGNPVSFREKTAKLLNCNMKEVALTENNTCAMSYIASGMDLPEGSEVLITDQEHPGGQCPWFMASKRRNVTVTKIAVPKPLHSADEAFAAVMNAFSPRTRVLAISHVITGAGAILPVKEICAEAKRRGIYTVLDGAQAAGHIPVDVRDIGCDAYVGCFHKWLLGPAGNGFLYLNAERAREIWPILVSGQWENYSDLGFRLSQRGTGSLSTQIGAEAALDFHNQIGNARVCERVKSLGLQLREGLRKMPKVHIDSPVDENLCAGITVYRVEGYNGAQLQDEFWKRRMRPRASGGVGVRQSTHIFNSPEEIDRTLSVVRELGG
jgi:selenocysteine lyase/cysteine desulfurase